jgi:hypothetical protein
MKQVFSYDLDYTKTIYCDSTEGICVVNNGNVQFYYAVKNPQFRQHNKGCAVAVFDDLMALIDYFAYNAECDSYKDTQIYKEFRDEHSYAEWFNKLQY